eukprot:CAMPEP_0202979748 /NCGR_PEP_ID=MMETSP1396-20130829/85824_1 /ASSEMBLY_ACC=CAM_ASM_000872 /TAXON_ID= /ORGANISM="Pseudokeronopsis sp., Strain Brazil" /LENGTH=68 /DNA_ID=CAMNT_0049719331 /DNA_START=1 /DNA_END=207 /DNA_ORIENTATION=-
MSKKKIFGEENYTVLLRMQQNQDEIVEEESESRRKQFETLDNNQRQTNTDLQKLLQERGVLMVSEMRD